MPHARKYSKELLDRGARLAFESGRPVAHVARDLGVESETLRKHVRQVEADEGRRKDVLSSQEREEIKALRKEATQLRRASEILKAAQVHSHGVGALIQRVARGVETAVCRRTAQHCDHC